MSFTGGPLGPDAKSSSSDSSPAALFLPVCRSGFPSFGTWTTLRATSKSLRGSPPATLPIGTPIKKQKSYRTSIFKNHYTSSFRHSPNSGSTACLIFSISWSMMTNGPWKHPGGGNILHSCEASGGVGKQPPGAMCSPGVHCILGLKGTICEKSGLKNCASPSALLYCLRISSSFWTALFWLLNCSTS